ncbi:MAG: hypothetical protein KDC54_09480 [Lewinella sp.]|nr:hypothetical protein [Lewinella sp.]
MRLERYYRSGLWILLLLLSPTLWAQDGPPATEGDLEEAYQRRIRQEVLYGVYIPADLAEAFVQLDRLSDPAGRAAFRQLSEAEAMSAPFFSLGRWISYNWGFYGGSRFTVYLNQMGLHHPDDLTRFVLLMYHRHLNNRPLDPRPAVEELLERRKAADTDRLLQGEVLHEETHIKAPADQGGG